MRTETAEERTSEGRIAPFEPVLRPRVVDRLRRAAARRIALVVAPAGFGKSVAIRQYLETDGIEHLRFSVRKEHDTLVGFLRGLVLALEPIAPKASKSVAGAYEKASRGPNPVRDLAAWVAALIARYEGTIVVDDLHFAAGDGTKNLLVEIIDRSREAVRWIIAARSIVELPAASWLAYGQSEEALDQAALAFTIEEASAACESLGITTSGSDLKRVLDMTEGWPAAFSFAMRTSMSKSDITKAADGSRETIYNYLADQVFKSLDQSRQEFLLSTCMFPRLDRNLMRSLDPNCDIHIQGLLESASFLVSDGRQTLRYHDLFRDFLEHILRSRGKVIFDNATLTAVDRLEASGNADQALSICLRYGLTEKIDGILERHGWFLLEMGAIDSVTAGLLAIDRRVLSSSPILLSLQGRIDDGSGSYASADLYFERAFHLALDSEPFAAIAERWAVSLLNRFLIERARDVINRVDVTTCIDANASARLLGLKSAIFVRMGEIDQAKQSLRDGLELLPQVTEPATLALCLHYAAYVSMWLQRTVEARSYCLRALNLCREGALYDLGGRVSSVLYELAASRDDVSEIIYSLEQMNRFAQLSGDPGLRQFAIFSDYDASIERGDFQRGLDLYELVEAEVPLDEERWAQTVVAANAMRLACEGRFTEAYRLEVRYRLERLPSAARALRAAELALYSSCANLEQEARKEVEIALSFLPTPENAQGLLSARICKAVILTCLALIRQGLINQARETMRIVDVSGASHRSTRLLLKAARSSLRVADGSQAMSELEAALRELSSSRLGGYARLIQATSEAAKPPSDLYNLTKSEIRVVALLRAGLSSKEIADRLGRSPLTVDTHVKAILRKLGFRSRREAVAVLNGDQPSRLGPSR